MSKEMTFKSFLPDMNELAVSTYHYNKLKFQRTSYDGQDNYVMDMYDGKKKGFFMEIGAGDAYIGSNTFLLEKIFEWQGILVEQNKSYYESLDRQRINSVVEKCHIVSADTMVYPEHTCKTIGKIFEDNKNFIPQFIDYISLDIDDVKLQYEILEQIDYAKYTIGIIIVEHALYTDLTLCNSAGTSPANKYRKMWNDLLLSKDFIYDGNLYVNDIYIHKSIYDKIKDNKNKDYDYWLRFDI